MSAARPKTQTCTTDTAVVPPGYKRTEVGVIPEDWKTRKLGEQATFTTGPFGSALHKSDYTDDGVPVINPMHIIDDQLVPTRTMTITHEAAKQLAVFKLRAGDIIIGRRGEMGRCAVVQKRQAGWLCGTGSLIIRCAESIAPEFLQRVLSSPRSVSSIEDASVGSTMVNLNQGVLADLKIQFPPPEEQHAIAAALSDVDGSIEALDKLIAKKRAIKQAAMQQLLTGKTRLPGFEKNPGYKQTEVGVIPKDWEVVLLKGISSFVGSGKSKSDSNNGNYPLYGSTGVIGCCSAPEYTGKSVLVARVGANAGRLNLIDGCYGVTDNTIIVKLINDVNIQFVFYQLSTKNLKALIFGSGQPLLTGTQLKSLQIILPSKHEQHAIASVLSDMDTEICVLERRKNKTKALKQGMMQELLTGRTRLV